MMPDFADISAFTPQEQAALNYHRSHLINNTYKKNPDKSFTTFYGTVVDTDQGAKVIPTYWGGQTREVPDAMRFAARSNIDFPTYADVPKALEAEKRMHDIMEQDIGAFMKAKNATR
jgi:hypothetical protein